MTDLQAASWSAERLPEIVALFSNENVASAISLPNAGYSEEWIGWAAEKTGISIESVELTVKDVSGQLASSAPAFLELPSRRFLVIESSRRDHVTLVSPNGKRLRVSAAEITDLLMAEVEAEHADLLATVFGSSRKSTTSAKRSFLSEYVGQQVVGRLYAIESRESESLITRLKEFGSIGLLVRLIVTYVAIQGAWIGSWIIIGAAALFGNMDSGRLLGWALLLLSIAPLRGYATWLEGKLAVDIGLALKGRLMQGALKIDVGTIQGQGVSRLLGRVIESDTVERSLVRGGVAGLFAAVELIAALVVLAFSTDALLVLALAILLLLAFVFWGQRYLARQSRLVDAKLDLTGSLVEKMTGHRTRTVQGADWNDTRKEADDLVRYFARTELVDRAKLWLATALPRVWLFAATTAIALTWWWTNPSIEAAAVTIGGVLLFYRALLHLGEGALSMADAFVAWTSVQEIYRAAEGEDDSGDTSALLPVVPSNVEVRNLDFSFPGASEPVLKNVDFAVSPGDRVLLEGKSGSGKSTLALVLAGINVPDSGLMLAAGVDRSSLGEQGWRKRVVVAPQFDSNHVLIGSIGFNLLMGRRWPPTRADAELVQEICSELGLDDLLSRMPSGLAQPVGEIGWQLSHGEKSRLYVARTLLQGAPTVILDESLSALDAKTMIRTMETIRRRVDSLIVIAHP